MRRLMDQGCELTRPTDKELQVPVGNAAQHFQCTYEIAFSRAIRADKDVQFAEFDLGMTDRCEAFDLDRPDTVGGHASTVVIPTLAVRQPERGSRTASRDERCRAARASAQWATCGGWRRGRGRR